MLLSASAAEVEVSHSLQPGWNAIWLDVSPVNADGDPADIENVFTNAAISFVAQPRTPSGTAEFIADASEERFNQDQWKTWWRSSELGENSLATISGNQAYLVKVDGASPITIEIEGEVDFHQVGLRADAYTLAGFRLEGTPSFDEFFASETGTVLVNRIFRLSSGGNWVGVTGADVMGSNEAYWIYAEEAVPAVGNVSVSFENLDGLNFGSSGGDVTLPDPDGAVGTIQATLKELVFSNSGTAEADIGLRLFDAGATPETDELRLYLIEPNAELSSYSLGNQVVEETLNVSAGESNIVSLVAHRNWADDGKERENVYQIIADHQVYWLRVRAENPEATLALSGQVSGGYAGLWVGEIVVDEVSRVDRPDDLQATTSSAPLRIILHSDDDGNVSLLPHVMFMQEKRASTDVPAVPVLFVDESKIPFYEGIEERAGKRVGIRIESIGFDMPREITITNQADLLQSVVDLSDTDSLTQISDVTDADIASYIYSRTSRPPSLVEEYHETWPLSGSLGASNEVATSTPLVLDPFHRANPFRHAFHNRHVAGFPIERTLTITLSEEPSDGVLTGEYTEGLSGPGNLSGLAAFDIQTRGQVRLERVVPISTLN